MQNIDLIVKDLTADQKNEVSLFVQDLLEKQEHRPRTYLRLDWVGTLSDVVSKTSSLELQKTALVPKEGE